MEDITKFPIISLLGLMASGKGTLGARLAADYDLYHMSIGDVLRAKLQPPIPGVSDPINELVAQGKPIPDEMAADLQAHYPLELQIYGYLVRWDIVPPALAFPLLTEQIERVYESGRYRGVLLDGVPRELGHLEAAERILPALPGLLIFLDCPEEVARARYLGRARSNDDNSSFDHRLEHFREHMPPVLDYFEAAGSLVRIPVDGMATIDAAYASLVTRLGKEPKWQAIMGASK
ncbi:P-loop containing nucleoside triphosphate hydrolase protein [Xylariaceae sp. FL0662B]|nr:P-loop containing nucleoside triphosphate hydrolase protein [Xylariaceae sp. FL0662B]